MKILKEDWIAIFENAISWVVVMAMMVYGMGKITQFGDLHQGSKAVSELTGMELMWAFYGYSKPYALIIGFFEVLGGLLILVRKTRLIGCFLVSAILINVILQDIFYDVLAGALKAAILYQFLIFVILWLNRKKMLEIFQAFLSNNILRMPWQQRLVHLVLAFILFILFRIGEYYWSVS